ncbi:MAG: dihydroorotate dehydrogenase electron transfer subunit [Clostridiaceae bacterium]|nr:dihydroorotate dehydrogenase electron transfer subunit [Clostridiaceae bacterium]
MEERVFTVISHAPVARDVYRLTLSGDTGAILAPGQFVDVALPGKYLRRPFSVSDWNDKQVVLLYKVVGSGTEQLSHMQSGETLNLLTGLGNGFDASMGGRTPVLVGGGLGAAPLPALARVLRHRGVQPTVYLGFASAADVILADELRTQGMKVHVATVDGSAGHKGFVTDLLPAGAYVFACGPEPMLRAVYEKAADGQFSFEAHMGCGFGACMGCTCETTFGPKRVCKDGPVFCKEEILWQI